MSNIQEQQERFVIDSDSKADWALEKLKDLKAKKQEKEDLANERVAQIGEWLEKETSKIDDKIEYFEGMLTGYAVKLKEADPELKTHSLPFGKLRFRSQRPKWHYDDTKLLESVEGAGLDDLIKIKKSVSKADLKKIVDIVNGVAINKDTGEIIEGVTVEERDEKFSIDY